MNDMEGTEGMGGIEFVLLLPEIALAFGAVAVLLIGSWTPRRRQWITRRLAVAVLAVAATAAAVGAGWPAEVTAAGSYALDVGTHLTRSAVSLGTLVTVLIAAGHVAGHRRETEFYVLLLLGALGTVVMAGASDLLLLTAGYLLASIPLYALVGFGKNAAGSEAALKYYLMGALSGVLLLVGVTVVFGAGAATDYAALAESLPGAPQGVVAVGAITLLAGLLFKSGAVPVHFWIPDATQGAPSPVAAFLTTVPKIGALVAIYRFGDQALAGAVGNWPLLMALLAAAGMTLGNLAAFFQNDVRRLLAYSTISQVGYLLMAVAAFGAAELALPSLLYYLAAYTLTNLGAFAVVCALPHARTIADYTGLIRRHPWLALSLIVCLLGLVGTPPTAVFIGKLTVFTAALDAGLGWLVVVAAVNTVASLFYYLRWVLPTFTPAPANGAEGDPADDTKRPSADGEGSTPADGTKDGPAEDAGNAPAPLSGAIRSSAGVAIALALASLAAGVAASPLLDLVQAGGLLR